MAATNTLAGGGIAPIYQEDVGSSNDSMTAFMRSLNNTLGATGQESFNAGKGNLAAGQQTNKTGLKTYGAGQQQYGQGVQGAAPVMDYLTKLVKGDQSDVQQAMQPANDQITQQFDMVRQMISAQPRGGGKASALAEAPFKEAQAKATMANQARASAAPELGNMATTLAGLGISEQGMGVGEQGIGVQQQGVGVQQQGLGLQGLQDAAGNNLTRRGQNMGPGSFGSNFGNVMGGISTGVGAAAMLI